MRATLRRSLVILPILMIGALAGGTSAMADLDSYVTGGHAWRGTGTVNIKDTLGNDQSVYVQYATGGSTIYRLDNNAGVGTTVSKNASVSKLRACQNINLRPDACDSYKS